MQNDRTMSDNASNLREILDSWVDAVNEGDLDRLGGLYRHGAVLIPTFSKKIISTPEEIADYFVQITTGRSVKVILREETVVTQDEDGCPKVIGGIYDWHINEHGQEKSIAARFSFALAPGDAAPIVHHHSSLLPVE